MEPPIHCLYKKCKYTDKTAADDDISFVPFPKPLTPRVRTRVEKWLYACGRTDIPVSFVEKNYDRCYVCCTHFIGSDGPTKLCPDPICFLRDEPSEVKTRNKKHKYQPFLSNERYTLNMLSPANDMLR